MHIYSDKVPPVHLVTSVHSREPNKTNKDLGAFLVTGASQAKPFVFRCVSHKKNMGFQHRKLCCSTYYFKVESLTNKSTTMMQVNVLYGKAVNGILAQYLQYLFFNSSRQWFFYVVTVTPVRIFRDVYPVFQWISPICASSRHLCALKFLPGTTPSQHRGYQVSVWHCKY